MLVNRPLWRSIASTKDWPRAAEVQLRSSWVPETSAGLGACKDAPGAVATLHQSFHRRRHRVGIKRDPCSSEQKDSGLYTVVQKTQHIISCLLSSDLSLTVLGRKRQELRKLESMNLLALFFFGEIAREQNCLLTSILYSFLADFSIFVLFPV